MTIPTFQCDSNTLFIASRGKDIFINSIKNIEKNLAKSSLRIKRKKQSEENFNPLTKTLILSQNERK